MSKGAARENLNHLLKLFLKSVTASPAAAAPASPAASSATAAPAAWRTVNLGLMSQLPLGIGKCKFGRSGQQNFPVGGFGGAGGKPYNKIVYERSQYEGKQEIAYVLHGLRYFLPGQKGMDL